MDIVVGTAGHIDHGKTALVKALTGVDADRLPEEKQRGITIDLGFAELDLGDVRIGFVDVPGHEKFVKNMLAGVSGIDLVMLVVAADEGVMPQTREHFDICRLLNVRSGLVVLTKGDLVDDETLELARMDVAELVHDSFLENVPVAVVSARTGVGIDELKGHILAASRTLGSRTDDLIARLPVDRSFSVKGFGAVVTGTLVSGGISEEDELELLPDGQKVRVRGLQTHGRIAGSVHAGQRAAVNLAGVDHDEITRGMVLCERGVLRLSQILDCEIEVLSNAPRGLRTRQRVRIHIGTAEVLARVSIVSSEAEIAPGSGGLAQLRLESPIAAIAGERFIIRQYSPQTTIAGGRVLDPLAEKHRRKDLNAVQDRLERLVEIKDHTDQIWVFLEGAGRAGLSFSDLQARTGLRKAVLSGVLNEMAAAKQVIDAGGHFISLDPFLELKAKAQEAIGHFHKTQPLSKGMTIAALRDDVFAYISPAIARSVLSDLEAAGEIEMDGDIIRLAQHRAELSADERTASEKLLSTYTNAGFGVPRLDVAIDEASRTSGLPPSTVRKLFHSLVDAAELVKVTDEFYFSQASIDALTGLLRESAAATSDSTIDVAKFKDAAGISRKYAIPLLEYFDRSRITVRIGDKRKVL